MKKKDVLELLMSADMEDEVVFQLPFKQNPDRMELLYVDCALYENKFIIDFQ